MPRARTTNALAIAPSVMVAPDSIAATLASGDSSSRPLTLTNSGSATLTFQVTWPKPAAGPALVGQRLAAVPSLVPDSIFSRADPVAVPANPGREDRAGPSLHTLAPAAVPARGSVLVIGDGGTEADVSAVLVEAGYAVSIVADDAVWIGTNPAPQGFDLVVLLDGVGYGSDMPLAGQTTLLNYVERGGGLIVTEWSSWEVAQGRYQAMLPLIPVTRSSGGTGVFTNTLVVSHAVTEGVSPSFRLSSGMGLGTLNSGTAIVELAGGEPTVVVKQQGSGRLVYLAHAGNYFGFRPFLDENLRQILRNAAGWVRGSVWLSLAPSSGSVAPGESVTLDVGLSARVLPAGAYGDDIELITNDSLLPQVFVPVRLAVGIAPVMDVQPQALSFGARPLGVPETLSVRIRNLGSDLLSVAGVSSGSTEFEVLGSGAFVLAPGESRDVFVRMGRAALGAFNALLSIASNDPSRPVAQVSLSGTAEQPPQLGFSPERLDLAVAAGEVAATPLQLNNTGLGPLDFSLVTSGATWLSLAPGTGQVAAGGEQVVQVGADARSLFAGTYLDTLRLTTNDPVPGRTNVRIPVRLVVSGRPGIAATPDTLRFTEAWAGVPTGLPLTIRNTGTSVLGIGSITFSNPRFRLAAAPPATIAPAQQALLQVLCDSPVAGTEAGTLTITNDDPIRPISVVYLEATVRLPGQARLEPPSLGLTLNQDAMGDLQLTLFNDGPGPLGFTLTAAPSWLSFTPAAGTVSPSGNQPIAAHIDAHGLPPGVTGASPVLGTTDPRASQVAVPVTLQVDGLPPAPPVADAPLDGQVNVGVRPQFRWQAAMRALRYDLFVWRASDPVPTVPTVAGLTQTSFSQSVPLQPGVAYRWQVVAVDATGRTPGPVLAFTTETLPDLLVTLVEVPPTAFSGQPVSVRYVITNQGLNGTNAPVWVDQVYLSPSATFDAATAIPEGAPQNPAFLAPGESYSVTTSFTLPRGIVGGYHVFVFTDAGGAVIESDETNNRSAVSPTMQVLLTPPPNLVVQRPVNAPANGFSGEPALVSWTVRNDGTGDTRIADWVDAVYLSADTVLSPGADVLLGTAFHVGALAPGQSYARSLSVNLPQADSGPRWFLVLTDAGNAVYENVFESDNATPAPIAVALTPPPDLVVGDIVGSSTAESGRTFSVQWRVTNDGAGDPFESSWFDAVYLCPTTTFDPAVSVSLGNTQHFGMLAHGDSYVAQRDFTLPAGINGAFYVFVRTDVGNEVFEGGHDSNNQGRSLGTSAIALTPPPNLVPMQIVAPASGRAGDPLTVSWSVENRGTGATPNAFWVDRVYLVRGTIWDQAQVLAFTDVEHRGALAVTGRYSGTATLTPPADMNGIARVFVETDVSALVFEHLVEADNRAASDPVAISTALPADLVAAWESVPAQVTAGALITATWSVRNAGVRATLISNWMDEVFLSSDATLDPATDVPVTSLERVGSLGLGGQYVRTITARVPDLPAGTYRLFVVTDRPRLVLDSNAANNEASVPVTLLPRPPAADLVVSQLAAPAQVMAGQSLLVSWSVQNQGPGATARSSWYDGVYLSGDPFVDGGDARIASLLHTGGLASGAGYGTSLGIDVPSYLAGNYYLIVACDSRGEEDERSNEGNNTANSVLNVQVPPPCDLIVSDVVVPASAIPGHLVTVSWTLANVGANHVTGTLRDGVYISRDPLWNVDDAVVGLLDHVIDLAPGATARFSAEVDVGKPVRLGAAGDVVAPLPGLEPGLYQFLIRTDLRNVIRESDDSNNLRASEGLTDVNVALMTLGVGENVSLFSSQQAFYRLDVAAGLDLRVDLSGGLPSGWGEVYVAFGRVPSLSDFDVSSALPFSTTQRALVPTTQAGTYYLMVVGRGFGISGATLTAQAMPFQILDGTPSAGGVDGTVTCRYHGAGFQPGMQAFLRDGSGTTFAASHVDRISNSECVVAWNTRERSLGTFDVVFSNPGGAIVALSGGFRIEAKQPYRIASSQTVPTALRGGATAVFTLQFENAGNVDVPYVFVVIELPAGQPIRVVSDRLMPLSRFIDSTSNALGTSFYESGGMRYMPFMARDVTVGEILQCTVVASNGQLGRLPIRVRTIGMGTTTFALAAIANIEQLRKMVLASPESFDPSLALLAPSFRDFRNRLLEELYARGLVQRNVADAVVADPPAPGATAGGTSADGCHQAVTWAGCGVDVLACALKFPIAAAFGLEIPWILDCTLSITVGCILEPLAPPSPVGELVLGITDTFTSFVDFFTGALDPVDVGKLAVDAMLTGFDQLYCTQFIRSSDPNDIQGPAGVGPEHWLAKQTSVPYVIRFENDSTRANGPARVVEIRQRLDETTDPRTFRLGRIGIGAVTLEVPANRAFYSHRLDLRDSLGVFVDVNAGVDVTTSEAFWVLRAVDPATGQAPENPLLGLLPVNDVLHRGEGFVSYTISPIATAASGDSLRAKARIVFDNNDPIDTPEYSNTLDAAAPSSEVSTLPDGLPADPFVVTWHGSDDARGSGLQAFDVFVRRGSGPDSLWIAGTTDTSAVFEGVTGVTYSFFTVATDRTGLREAPPSTPDAVVTLGLPSTDAPPRPRVLALYGVRPNPARADLSVAFSLASNGPATLELFDVAGRRVLSRAVGALGAGQHVVPLGNERKIRPGIYVVRLCADGQKLKIKAVVVQ